MFNLHAEPEKIVDFSVQNGIPYYRIQWYDSWIPHDALSSSWQHLLEMFWKRHQLQTLQQTQQHNLQQQITQLQPPSELASQQQEQQQQNHQRDEQKIQQQTNQLYEQNHHQSQQTENKISVQNDEACEVRQLEPTNKYLPTFSSLLSSTHDNDLENNEKNFQASSTAPQPSSIHPNLDFQAKEPLTAAQETADLLNFSADFQINALLQTPIASNNNVQTQEKVTSKLKEKKSRSSNSNTTTKARVVRKVKPKVKTTDNNQGDTITESSCKQCGRDFSHTACPRKRLREHMRRIHLKNGKFSCTQCSKTFTCRQGLRDHEPVHSKERNHRCSYCGQTFLRSSHLYIHVRTHEEERNFRCEACFDTFSVQSELKEHCENVHNQVSVDVKCSVCKQNLYSSQSIYSHSLRHSGKRNFKCDDCGAAFKRKQILDHHKKTHEADKRSRKNEKCDICKKEFTTRSTLREHMFIVHDSAMEGSNHKCEICGKSFCNWANYNRHLQQHPNIKEWVSLAGDQETNILETYEETDLSTHQFKCNACSAEFTVVKSFLSHLRQHQILLPLGNTSNDARDIELQQVVEEKNGQSEKMNSTNSVFSCTVCEEVFINQDQLQTHMNIHRETELRCGICSMDFKRRETLRVHKKRHILRNETSETYLAAKKCTTNDTYNHRKELYSKLEQPDASGKRKCPYCEKIFEMQKLLLAHIVIHDDVFHMCDVCGKSYKQKSCLNKHKQIHLNSKSERRGRPKKTSTLKQINSKKEPVKRPLRSGTRKQKNVSNSGINETFQCLSCTEVFLSHESLELHMKSHERDMKNHETLSEPSGRQEKVSNKENGEAEYKQLSYEANSTTTSEMDSEQSIGMEIISNNVEISQ